MCDLWLWHAYGGWSSSHFALYSLLLLFIFCLLYSCCCYRSPPLPLALSLCIFFNLLLLIALLCTPLVHARDFHAFCMSITFYSGFKFACSTTQKNGLGICSMKLHSLRITIASNSMLIFFRLQIHMPCSLFFTDKHKRIFDKMTLTQCCRISAALYNCISRRHHAVNHAIEVELERDQRICAL